jgi:hypothetical protein
MAYAIYRENTVTGKKNMIEVFTGLQSDLKIRLDDLNDSLENIDGDEIYTCHTAYHSGTS